MFSAMCVFSFCSQGWGISVQGPALLPLPCTGGQGPRSPQTCSNMFSFRLTVQGATLRWTCSNLELTAQGHFSLPNTKLVTMKFWLSASGRLAFDWNVFFLLPSATKLRRLCFYRRVSVHRGRCLPQCMLGYHTPPPGSRHPPWEQTPPPRSGHPPGTDTPRSGHPREQTPHQEQTPPSLPPEQAPPPRYGHCCGRYASYRNAFLLYHFNFWLEQLGIGVLSGENKKYLSKEKTWIILKLVRQCRFKLSASSKYYR